MQHRLEALRQELEKRKLDAFVTEDPTNLFYYTGLQLSAGLCLVTESEAFLLVDGRYIEGAKKNSPIPTLLRKKGTLDELLASLSLKTIAFDSGSSTYAQFATWQKAAPSIDFQPINSFAQQVRAVKDDEEQDALKAAGELGSRGFDYGLTLLREGISETELARAIDLFWRQEGSDGAGFEPIVAFGPNSSMPHHRAGETRLKEGDVVLIDIGVSLNHYQSDMCRVVFFGEPDPRIEEVYSVVLEAQQAALDLAKVGATAEGLDEAARAVIDKAGYGDLFTHSLGHGIGLEVHEYPYLRTKQGDKETPLEPGMAFTIEPGIYLPEIGGVRIEDSVIVTENGTINLTNRPKELTYIPIA